MDEAVADKRMIVHSAALELLHRLTESLEIPFTLTDSEGTVVASTAGRPAGQIDAYALSVMRRGEPFEFDEANLRAPDHLAYSPAAEHAGLLPPAPGIYSPVRIAGNIAGVLFARGEPESIRVKAQSAAAVAGFALELASGAADSVRDTLGPDLALRALLRGNQSEARRATLLAKAAGWDLLAPRAALAIQAAPGTAHLPDTGLAVLRDLMNALAPGTPAGRMSSTEWVALAPLPRTDAHRPILDIAREIEQTLAAQGLPVVIGVGETHIDLPVLPGLRRSYREAEFCAISAIRLGASQGIHTLDSLGPLAFMAPGQQARVRFATTLLEPLRDSPEILATVRVFLDSDLSLEAAAKRSGQHRHTIRSHLQRARELTGLDPRVLADAVQLKLALLLAPVQSV